MEETEIETLGITLTELGISDVKIIKSADTGTVWIGITQGFRVIKHECGIILLVNGIKILVKKFQSFLSPIENKTLKSVILAPIKPTRA